MFATISYCSVYELCNLSWAFILCAADAATLGRICCFFRSCLSPQDYQWSSAGPVFYPQLHQMAGLPRFLLLWKRITAWVLLLALGCGMETGLSAAELQGMICSGTSLENLASFRLQSWPGPKQRSPCTSMFNRFF
jgi:hypothetical protein